MLISCSKSCGTRAQAARQWQTRSARSEENAKLLLQKFPQSASDFVLPIVRWSYREHILSIKKTKSVAYWGNFWSRSLARFMRAAQFASVSSCARRLLKHFRCKSLQNNLRHRRPMNTRLQWFSWTVLWVCGLSSWLRTKSLTVLTFSSVRAQIDNKSK